MDTYILQTELKSLFPETVDTILFPLNCVKAWAEYEVRECSFIKVTSCEKQNLKGAEVYVITLNDFRSAISYELDNALQEKYHKASFRNLLHSTVAKDLAVAYLKKTVRDYLKGLVSYTHPEITNTENPYLNKFNTSECTNVKIAFNTSFMLYEQTLTKPKEMSIKEFLHFLLWQNSKPEFVITKIETRNETSVIAIINDNLKHKQTAEYRLLYIISANTVLLDQQNPNKDTFNKRQAKLEKCWKYVGPPTSMPAMPTTSKVSTVIDSSTHPKPHKVSVHSPSRTHKTMHRTTVPRKLASDSSILLQTQSSGIDPFMTAYLQGLATANSSVAKTDVTKYVNIVRQNRKSKYGLIQPGDFETASILANSDLFAPMQYCTFMEERDKKWCEAPDNELQGTAAIFMLAQKQGGKITWGISPRKKDARQTPAASFAHISLRDSVLQDSGPDLYDMFKAACLRVGINDLQNEDATKLRRKTRNFEKWFGHILQQKITRNAGRYAEHVRVQKNPKMAPTVLELMVLGYMYNIHVALYNERTHKWDLRPPIYRQESTVYFRYDGKVHFRAVSMPNVV